MLLMKSVSKTTKIAVGAAILAVGGFSGIGLRGRFVRAKDAAHHAYRPARRRRRPFALPSRSYRGSPESFRVAGTLRRPGTFPANSVS